MIKFQFKLIVLDITISQKGSRFATAFEKHLGLKFWSIKNIFDGQKRLWVFPVSCENKFGLWLSLATIKSNLNVGEI